MATGVSCEGEIEKCLIIVRKDLLECKDKLHPKAVKSQNTVRMSFLGKFAFLITRKQTLFLEKVAAVSTFVYHSVGRALIAFCGNIMKCKMTAQVGLGRSVGGLLVSSRTSATVPEAGRSSKISWPGPSK